MKSRLEQIRQYRLRQPLKELQRKMQKVADNRANVWTQEGIDYADAVATRLYKQLNVHCVGDSAMPWHDNVPR